MVAVATTLPCGYSGIEAEMTITYPGSGGSFNTQDQGRWEHWLESLAGHTDIIGPDSFLLLLASDVIRFIIDGGSNTEKQETSAAAALILNNTNAGIGQKVEVEVLGYETYTFDCTNWVATFKGNPAAFWQSTATGDNAPIRRSNGSREPAGSTSSFDECTAFARVFGAIVRIKRR